MKILPISQTNNQLEKTTFKASDYFAPVKKLPGMFCASCGKPTLDIDVYVKKLIPICKPLSVAIKKGAFDTRYQKSYPLIYEKLVELANLYPEKTIDKILETEKGTYAEIKCAVVKSIGTENVENNTLERFALDRKINHIFFDTLELGRTFMKSSAVVIKELLKLKKYLEAFSKVRADVFTQLEIYARKYPRKSLSEIIQIPEIASFHKMKNILQRTESRELLDYHFQNIREMIKKQKPEATEYFDELKEKVLDMYESEPDEKARIYRARSMYQDALAEHGCENLKDRVLEELSKVPTSFVTKDSFFATAASRKFSDIQIVNALFKDLLTSEDHVGAISRGGRDFAGNKIVMHAICNFNKGSKPCAVFSKYHPEMLQYAPEQVAFISQNILKEKLPDNLRTYPLRIADTLRVDSDEKILIDVVKYCEQILKQSLKRTEKNNKRLEELKKSPLKNREEIKNIITANKEEAVFQSKLSSYLLRYKKTT